jgi:glycosyltransferase involved in cell wall biosynthesis
MLDPWFRERNPLKHAAKQFFWWAFEGRLLSHATAVLFTAEEERRLARDQFIGWRYTETVVPFGTMPAPAETSAQRAAFERASRLQPGQPYLLYLSRIHPKKGCDILLEAFAHVAAEKPELRLIISGPDQIGWTPLLQQQADKLGLADRVHWTGPLFGEAKWGALRGAEALVLPSHQENFGIVVAEALACGTPVLISDKVNIWREIHDAGAGFVNTDDVTGTEASLRDWINSTSDRRDEMRRAAAALFTSRFDIRVNVAEFADLLAAGL